MSSSVVQPVCSTVIRIIQASLCNHIETIDPELDGPLRCRGGMEGVAWGVLGHTLIGRELLSRTV